MRFAPRCVAIGLLSLWAAAASPAEIKLATWDFGWLTLRPQGDPALPERVGAKRPDDLARLARYAQALAADVVALQGVDGPEVAGQVFPPGEYTVVLTGDSVLQRTGFALRRGVRFDRNPDVRALNPYPDAVFPLRGGADITLQAGGQAVRLLSVHLKSGCRDGPLDRPDDAACATLARQAAALATWIAARERDHEAFLVLGDFGRVMEGPDPFLATLATAGPLLRPTEHHASPCWGGSDFVDHILAGGAARAWTEADSLRVMVYRETESAWRARLSEHCPVSIRLRIPD